MEPDTESGWRSTKTPDFPKGKAVIEEGMVFTVEPGIYIPGWGGVRLEDMVRVTSNGCERLTYLSKEIKDNIVS